MNDFLSKHEITGEQQKNIEMKITIYEFTRLNIGY